MLTCYLHLCRLMAYWDGAWSFHSGLSDAMKEALAGNIIV